MKLGGIGSACMQAFNPLPFHLGLDLLIPILQLAVEGGDIHFRWAFSSHLQNVLAPFAYSDLCLNDYPVSLSSVSRFPVI